MRNCAIIHPLHLELETAGYNPIVASYGQRGINYSHKEERV